MLYWSDFVELVFYIGLRDFIFVSLKLRQVSKKKPYHWQLHGRLLPDIDTQTITKELQWMQDIYPRRTSAPGPHANLNSQPFQLSRGHMSAKVKCYAYLTDLLCLDFVYLLFLFVVLGCHIPWWNKAVYNVSWICREQTARTVNCCNYSYFV